ncbi:MAG: HAD-IA family hydrolase [Clostridiales bacterium]
MKITTVFFDFDGTLANTIPGIMATMAVVKEKMNADFSLAEAEALIGKPLVNMGEILVGAKKSAEFLNIYLESFPEHGGKMIKFFNGIEEMLKNLKAQNIETAVITSKRGRSLNNNLTVLNAHDYFDLLVTSDSTIFHKPHPAPVEFALDRMGKDAKECVMVGDTEYDILAGKGAYVKTIGVTWGIEKDMKNANYCPDYIANSPQELYKIIISLTK